MAGSPKKYQSKIRSFNWYGCFINGKKDGRCDIIYQYVKPNNKYMKSHNKNKESSDLKYWDINDLYGWAISQTLSVTDFKWVE